jgi:predicted amidohydrolase
MEFVEARLSLLEAAIAKALRVCETEQVRCDGPIKMIFAAPEYLMTAPRSNFVDVKALVEDDRDMIVRELRRISQNLPGVLLVPGTIAFQKELERSGPQRHKMNPKTGERDGPLKTSSREEKALHALDSAWSHLNYSNSSGMGVPGDKILNFQERRENFERQLRGAKGPLIVLNDMPRIYKNNMYVFLDGVIAHKYSKQADWFETLGSSDQHFIPGGSSCTKEIAGIRFGFEICMDHSMRMLGTSQGAYRARGMKELGTPPDIHIIVSDYTGNQYFPMRNGGFMLHASTRKENTAVYRKNSKGYIPIGSDVDPDCRQFAEVDIEGSPLRLWSINLEQ